MCKFFDNCAKSAIDKELQHEYRYNSVMMYYWTIDTVSSEPYYAIRKKIINDLNLNSLRKEVRTWSKESKMHLPFIIKFPTIIAINILRIKHSLGKILRKIIQK
jgi:hypothetical protein